MPCLRWPASSPTHPTLQAQLFAALDLQLIYKKDTHQVTIRATITPSTPATLAAIIALSEPPTTPTAATGLAHSVTPRT